MVLALIAGAVVYSASAAMAVLTAAALSPAARARVAPVLVVLTALAPMVLVPVGMVRSDTPVTLLESVLGAGLVCCMARSIAVIADWHAGTACSAITNNTPILERKIKECRADHRPAPLLILTTPPGGPAISTPPIPRASDRN